MIFPAFVAIGLLACASANAFEANATSHTIGKAKSLAIGVGTFYSPNRGACGEINDANDFIVALNKPQWGTGVNQRSSRCFNWITIKRKEHVVHAQVADVCPECPYGNLDMTTGLFRALGGTTDMGIIDISWDWGKSDPRAHGKAPVHKQKKHAKHSKSAQHTTQHKHHKAHHAKKKEAHDAKVAHHKASGKHSSSGHASSRPPHPQASRPSHHKASHASHHKHASKSHGHAQKYHDGKHAAHADAHHKHAQHRHARRDEIPSWFYKFVGRDKLRNPDGL